MSEPKDPSVIHAPDHAHEFVPTDYARDTEPPDPVLRLGGLTIFGDRKALFSALARAQGKYEAIERSRTVTVRSDKGNYTFDYAPLENVISATRDALASEGLAWSSLIADPNGEAETELHTLLSHESGAFMHVAERLPAVSKAQERGSQLTYKRRYQYQCLTGTSPEVDDDGNAADGNTVQDMKNKGPRREAPAAPPKKAEPKQTTEEFVAQKSTQPAQPAAPKSEPPPPPKVDPEAKDTPQQNEIIKGLFERYGFKGTGKSKPFVKAILGIWPNEISKFSEAQKVISALEDEEVRQRTIEAIGGLTVPMPGPGAG